MLRFTGAGFPLGAQCVLGVQNATGLTPAQIGAQVSTAWQNRLRAQTMTGYTLADIAVTNGPSSAPTVGTTVVGLAGSQAGALLPPNCAFLVRKITAVGGRKGRGRVFYPSLGETFVDDAGNLTGGVAASSDTRWNGFRTDLAAANLPLALFHALGTTPDLITLFQTQGRIATQRDRLRA